MTPPTKTRRAIYSKLDKLRLLVADEIICNSLNMDVGRFNIRAQAASSELCEQYCLKLFLHWLATKYGSSVCATAIQKASQADDHPNSGWPTFKDRFPFYSYFSDQFEERLRERVFDYLNANLQPSLEDAGSLYMQAMVSPIALDADGKPYLEPAAKRRRAGEFYTPAKVVDYCLEQTGFTSGSHTLVDPACGTGNFLLGALRRANGARLHTVKQLHGRDIDGRAIAIARVLLLIACSASTNGQPVETARADGTIAQDACGQSGGGWGDAEVWEAWHHICGNLQVADATAAAMPFPGYDIVVSNPPYLSFGSRNQPPMARSHDRYLRNTFAGSAEYKLRLHSIFQEIAINWCTPGGSAVMLVPDAFLTGSYYGRLRRFLLDSARIVSLTELPESTFDDAVAGRWCVAHYQRLNVGDESPDAATTVQLRRFANDGAPEEFCLRQSELVSSDSKLRLQLVFNRGDLDISVKLSKLPTVSSRYRGHTGIRARNGQASVVSESKGGGDREDRESGGNREGGERWKPGIVSGAEVQQYSIRWTGHWLHIEPKLLFGGGFNPVIVEAPKVLVRQTADRLIGAVDSQHFYHLNNVHSFSPLGEKTMEDAAFLCALLNSRLWLYLYQLKSRERKRALAQIDIEMVESLPLPVDNREMRFLIARAAQQQPHSGPVRGAVERAIYDLYKLSAEEIQHIEDSIGSFYAFPALCASEHALDLLQSLSIATI